MKNRECKLEKLKEIIREIIREELGVDPMAGDTEHTMDTANVNEETGTAAVAGYQTPFAFSKRSTGSKRALDATKKIGYKPAKKAYEGQDL